MIDIQNIFSAKEIICSTILNQVKNGKQSVGLPDALACGQFLKVPKSAQRGLHGTAAAIRVLADYNSTYNQQLKRLIKYIENIKEIETEGEMKDGLEKDLNNIIKNSEILYSLSYILYPDSLLILL